MYRDDPAGFGYTGLNTLAAVKPPYNNVSGDSAPHMAIVETIAVFVISLLIGALGIYAGARVITGTDDYTYALITALIGTLVWAVIAIFLGWIPLLGPLLALIAYVGVINYRYPGGWARAIGIALVAWLASLIVVYLLGTIGFASFDALGVPGA